MQGVKHCTQESLPIAFNGLIANRSLEESSSFGVMLGRKYVTLYSFVPLLTSVIWTLALRTT